MNPPHSIPPARTAPQEPHTWYFWASLIIAVALTVLIGCFNLAWDEYPSSITIGGPIVHMPVQQSPHWIINAWDVSDIIAGQVFLRLSVAIAEGLVVWLILHLSLRRLSNQGLKSRQRKSAAEMQNALHPQVEG